MSAKMLDKDREVIQNNAVTAWELCNKRGVIEAITGIGKNFIFFKALSTCEKGINVLFLAEQVDREYDMLKDLNKYNSIYGASLDKDYNITFMTYQSACKLENTHWDFVCADEIHDSLTPVYSTFYFKNTFKYFIGLSATIPNNTVYFMDGVQYSKIDILRRIAPICFRYTLKKGQEDGTARPLNIIVVESRLNSTIKNVEAGTKNKKFYTTELEAYNYWDNEFNKAMYLENPRAREFRMRMTAAARAKVLYKLPSKVNIAKSVLPVLKGKTLVFGNDLDTLLSISPNVICSRNSDKQNLEIRERFDKGEINTIGSFKKLKQGANLSNLDNIVIMSYYSTTKDLIQRVGRLRKDGQKVGNVIIFLTVDTKEEVWFNKMFLSLGLYAKRIKAEEIGRIGELLEYEKKPQQYSIESSSSCS